MPDANGRATRRGLDLEAAVGDVDVDAIARRLDVDAVARGLDVDAIIARIDVVGLVEEVFTAIDLPAIIRESTGSISSETVRGARMAGISVDEAITRASNVTCRGGTALVAQRRGARHDRG